MPARKACEGAVQASSVSVARSNQTEYPVQSGLSARCDMLPGANIRPARNGDFFLHRGNT